MKKAIFTERFESIPGEAFRQRQSLKDSQMVWFEDFQNYSMVLSTSGFQSVPFPVVDFSALVWYPRRTINRPSHRHQNLLKNIRKYISFGDPFDFNHM